MLLHIYSDGRAHLALKDFMQRLVIVDSYFVVVTTNVVANLVVSYVNERLPLEEHELRTFVNRSKGVGHG